MAFSGEAPLSNQPLLKAPHHFCHLTGREGQGASRQFQGGLALALARSSQAWRE